MKPKTTSLPAVGGSSLLTIFAVLCLVIFTLLTIATVQSQKSQSLACAQAAEGYYQADTRAETILAALRRGELPDGVTAEAGIYRYQCPISPTQHLEVRVEAQTCTVLQWQAVSTLRWEQNNDLNVWDGN